MRKRVVLLVASLLGAAFIWAVPAVTTFAAGGNTAQSDVCASIQGTENGSSCSTPNSTSSVSSLLKSVVDVLSTIIGAVAVIMIIIAGFQYVTSNGDSSKLTNARQTITYAMVGLVVVAGSQFLVKFVLTKI